MKITVYSYWTWVQGEGLGAIASQKRPADQIEALGGIIIPTSSEEMDESALTYDGEY